MNNWRLFVRIPSPKRSAHPLWYMLFYVLLIPAFAIIYIYLPGRNFYAPYSKFEESASFDSSAIKVIIGSAMIAAFHDNKASADGWQILRDGIHIYDLRSSRPDMLSFSARVDAVRQEGGKYLGATYNIEARVSDWIKSHSLNRRGEITTCHETKILTISPEQDQELAGKVSRFDASLLFRQKRGPPVSPHKLCLGPKDEKAAERYSAGFSGDPRQFSGFDGRMLYFSATTITTLGYGDIVPLSPAARWLSGIETILGWLFAGIFVNALTAEGRRS